MLRAAAVTSSGPVQRRAWQDRPGVPYVLGEVRARGDRGGHWLRGIQVVEPVRSLCFYRDIFRQMEVATLAVVVGGTSGTEIRKAHIEDVIPTA